MTIEEIRAELQKLLVKIDDKKEIELYYPKAIRKFQMPTSGKYKQGYPKGAVVHFTAGRSKTLADAEATINWGITKGYTYFCIASDGTVYQSFPINEYGAHCGESAYKELGTALNSKLVGIEICCAGLLEKTEDKYKSWFNEYYQENDVRYSKDCVVPGYYHKYTVAQEKALVELLQWLKKNNPDVFDFNYCVGHDEIALPKGRKNDPGASLSMSMDSLRELLKNGSI